MCIVQNEMNQVVTIAILERRKQQFSNTFGRHWNLLYDSLQQQCIALNVAADFDLRKAYDTVPRNERRITITNIGNSQGKKAAKIYKGAMVHITAKNKIVSKFGT